MSGYQGAASISKASFGWGNTSRVDWALSACQLGVPSMVQAVRALTEDPPEA